MRAPGTPDGGPGAKPGGESRGSSLVGLAREASLRERLVARDEQALVELVDLATPWLLGVAQAMLHDRDEAEEVVMEAFRTVWQNVTPAGEGYVGLMPYLLRVTRHRAIDRLRGRRRREQRLRAAAVEWNLEPVAPTEPNEAAHPGWQVHAKVHAALEALPPEQRTAVMLAYFGGLTQSEIAAQLGIPLGTVKTRLRLAFTRLRHALAGLREWVV
ncbi:MAG TPA: RNA polymerase sigma factor [Gemmatimonadales bacterium]